jgi:hypothetical protein
MTTDWTLQRHDDRTRGCLAVGGQLLRTLEPPVGAAEPRIPEGRYPVRLTLSGRAKAGTLWTPDKDFRLPELIGVPGRTAIRVHAGNTVENTQGCILVGLSADPDGTLVHSRVALMLFMRHLAAADSVYLTVRS